MSDPSLVTVQTALDILGIRADEGQVHWERTSRAHTDGALTVTLDLDLQRLSDEDRDFICGMGEALRALAERSRQ